MHIRLKVDIPINCSDMQGGAISKLYMELKKICDELNFQLNELDEDNLSDRLIERIETIEDRIAQIEADISQIETDIAQ